MNRIVVDANVELVITTMATYLTELLSENNVYS